MNIDVVIDNQKYTVEIKDINSRPVLVTVQGDHFEVWPEAGGVAEFSPGAVPTFSVPESEPVSGALEGPADNSGGRDVLSPLPGVIVAVLVKPGEIVTRGQELCTLEAMKMKNAIRANRDGTLATVEVEVGDQVNHGQVLITYAE